MEMQYQCKSSTHACNNITRMQILVAKFQLRKDFYYLQRRDAKLLLKAKHVLNEFLRIRI